MNHRFCLSFLSFATTFAVFCCVFPNSIEAQQRRGRGSGGGGWQFVAGKYDANKDGKVTAEEYTRGKKAFSSLDANSDGILDDKDWSSLTRSRGGSGTAPAVGDVAPNFSLTQIRDADKTVTLSDFAGKKPVALVFGSCT